MAGMAASGLPGMTDGGFGAPGLAGRLRPARPEEGIGLIWESDLPFLQGTAFGLPAPLFAIGPSPGLPGAPAAPIAVGTGPDAMFIPPTRPDQPIADATWMPEDPAVWTGPRAEDPGPGADPVGPGAGWMAPAGDPPRSEPPPAPLFPPPILDGGVARQVPAGENTEGVLHQPAVTDRAPDGLGWRILGGADAALLLMDPATGALRFLAPPDFEAPGDADADNRYEIVFEVRDGWGAAAQQALTIAVTDDPWG